MNDKIASVTLEDIHKSFGNNKVLRGISVTAHKGEVISVLGPSGSGKSTLLRCTNLLEIPDSGTLRVSGEEVVMKKNRRGQNQPVDMRQVERLKRHLTVKSKRRWPPACRVC